MQELTDWLTKLGLPESAGAFAENGIDVSVLPHLTDQASSIRGAPRCRQSVARISLDLNLLKAARW
jgi:hypothetical protein